MDKTNGGDLLTFERIICVFMVVSCFFVDDTEGKTQKTGVPQKIPIVYLKGDHYDIGLNVGTTFRTPIQKMMKADTFLHSKLLPFYETARGRTAYNQLLSASEEYLSQYVEEIRGIADGAKVSFIELFLLHIGIDLRTLMEDNGDNSESVPQREGCSDFSIKNDDWILHVHSEDVSPEIRHLGVIWMADIEASELNNYQSESYVAYAYTGMIPGYAWGMNAHGLVMSANYIAQKNLFKRGMLPRTLLYRALLKEKNTVDFLETIKTMPGSASGINFMLSQRVCSALTPDCVKMSGIEIFGDDKGNRVNIKEAGTFEFHFNEYLHIAEECLPDPSSKAREQRLQEFKQEFKGYPSTLEQIKKVMSDTQNKNFPFYRNGNPPDNLATTNIVIADMNSQRLNVYKDSPNDGQPVLVFDITPWEGRPISLTERIVTSDEGSGVENQSLKSKDHSRDEL